MHKLRKVLREVFLKPQKWRENQLEVTKENYIHEEMKKYNISPEIRIIEDDILQGETFLIEYSIYSMTIAALMTGWATPQMEGIAVKMCLLVFLIQTILFVGISEREWALNNFRRFEIVNTIMRVMGAILLHNISFGYFQFCSKLLFYIKSARKRHTRQKLLNLIIIMMMLAGPFMACFSMFVVVGQTKSLVGCITVYVDLGFIMNLDYMFAPMLPTEITKLVDNINS